MISNDIAVVAAVGGRYGVVSRLLDDDARLDGRGGDDGGDRERQERRRASATEKGGELLGRPMRLESCAGARVDETSATTTLDSLLPAVDLAAIEAPPE